jgi:SAM-dependent methyltransferase
MAASAGAGVRAYWNTHIHDLGITPHPPGSPAFFADLDAYHFEKLHHLLRLVDFEGWRGRRVLDVGCGTGVEVVRFARGGARVVGLDLAEGAIALTRQNLAAFRLEAPLLVGAGQALPFADETFDFVYAHGVMQYSGDAARLATECRRVARTGGVVLFQAYNRRSWLQGLSKLMRVPLEHEDAPVLERYTAAEFRTLIAGFSRVDLRFERFPVKSRLHKGWKGAAFNTFFVGAFNALPRAWVRRFGWHLLAVCTK